MRLGGEYFAWTAGLLPRYRPSRIDLALVAQGFGLPTEQHLHIHK